MGRRLTHPAVALLLATVLLVGVPLGAGLATADPATNTGARPAIPVPPSSAVESPVEVGNTGGSSSDEGVSDPPREATTSQPDVSVTAERASRSEEGLRYTVRVTDLDEVRALWILTAGATHRATSGAERAESASERIRWDGRSKSLRTSFVPAGDPAADGTLRVQGGDWAFGPVPPLVVAWIPEGSDRMHQIEPFEDSARPRVDVSAENGGYVGEKYALVGTVRSQRVETVNGTVRLLVPGDVSTRVDSDAIPPALSSIAAEFDDGGGPTDAVVFVLPSTVRPGGATFLSADEGWVNADSALHTANNVWFHEYVHTRQQFELGPRMGWFEEASAEYFGARLATETGYASNVDRELYWLGRTRTESTLTRPSTWTDSSVPYHRGALVLATLDDEIRTRTDSERSLENVFRQLNRHEGVVTYEVFVATVSEVAGDDMRPWLDRYVDGDAPVPGPTATSAALTTVQAVLRVEGPLRRGFGLLVLGGAVLHRGVVSRQQWWSTRGW
jgi:hypothetical protein